MLEINKTQYKEKVMLKHYKYIIEERIFDEYDILGFLIFIREKLDLSFYHLINEFTNLVAHRDRTKGLIMDNIANAINNNYSYNHGKVQGYNGINWETWVNEWKKLGKDFNISIDNTLIKEITLCIYSLVQDSSYDDGKGHTGKIELFIDYTSNSLCICTTEGREDSLYICFAKFGKFSIKLNFEPGHIEEAVETERKDGRLYLKCSKGTILEV